jgi:hypothetical protein
MFAQDRYGYLHDIPDAHLQDARVLYDGLGNPVGQLGDFFDFLKPIGQAITAPIQAIGQAAGHLLPAVGSVLTAPLQMATAPLQMAGGLLSNLLPHPSAPPPQPAPVPIPAPMIAPPAPMPFLPPHLMNLRPMQPTPPGHPWPLGWIRSQLPYTGLGPQRLYMRCAVWPGPAGLVPGPQMPTGPWPAPGAPGAGPGPGMPGFPGGRFHHHRGHRRHR